jgi:hypothetical protein
MLSLSRSEPVYGGTGVSGWVMRLTNRGTHPCRMRRRPDVALVDRNGAVPFDVSYHRRCIWLCAGRDRGIQSPWLVLPRRRSVFFAFSSYRCDSGTLRIAAAVQLRMPSALRVGLPHDPVIAWCGQGDPGSTLNLSPFEPTPQAAVART